MDNSDIFKNTAGRIGVEYLGQRKGRPRYREPIGRDLHPERQQNLLAPRPNLHCVRWQHPRLYQASRA